ncbi:MAG: PDGLE domain-containing protein [Marmoricola sp.]
MSTLSNRKFYLSFLLVALVIAGVVSFYASGHPDGLEYVAHATGFSDTAKGHSASGSPLADYGVAGVDNSRLSGGLAGVIGVGVTLLFAGGLALLLRSRSDTSQES